MKKILIVSEHNITSLGGIQKVISDITENLQNSYDFDVVVFENMEEEIKKKYNQYRNIYCIPYKINTKGWERIKEIVYRPFKVRNGLKRIIFENDYDVVHCHDIVNGGYALKYAASKKIPVRICQSHNSKPTGHRSIFRKMYLAYVNKNLKYANTRIGVSDIAGKAMFGDDSFMVIRNGVDFDRFNSDTHINMQDGKIHFIHVGRYTYQKNHEFLLNAFKLVHDKISNSLLTLIGWGALEEQIKRQIHELELDNAVTMLPGNSDVAKEMSKADYMIFPSRYEGFGLVSLEAQAMGVMCFASDVITDEVKKMGLWLTLPLEIGEEKWAERIIDFIENGERSNYKLNEAALEEFDIKNVIKEYARVYDEPRGI